MNRKSPRDNAPQADNEFQPAFLMRPAKPASAARAAPPVQPAQPAEPPPAEAARPAAPPRPAEGPIHGVVKWFNHAKGFGFILLDDGREVFVHSNRLDPAVARMLKPGLDTELMIVPVAKGFACQEILKLATAATPENLERVGWKPQGEVKRPAQGDAQTVRATIKFFNPQKGFGFATPEISLGRDIYLPARLLETAGIATTQHAGMPVEIDYVKTERGFEGVALRVLAAAPGPAEFAPAPYPMGPGDDRDGYPDSGYGSQDFPQPDYDRRRDEPPQRVLGPGDFVEPWRPA
ncbi:MAG: cold shock domain-containing protein [Rhodospirillales bacterium]|nr:cold shock domain-containing protein [Rhodospirillales bacterium]